MNIDLHGLCFSVYGHHSNTHTHTLSKLIEWLDMAMRFDLSISTLLASKRGWNKILCERFNLKPFTLFCFDYWFPVKSLALCAENLCHSFGLAGKKKKNIHLKSNISV